MLIVGSFFSSLLLGYAIYLFKWIKKYRQYRKTLQKLTKNPPLNISEIYTLFQNEPVGKKMFVIAKGIFFMILGVMKAKRSREDKNIFSAVVETPITHKNMVLRDHIFHKVSFRDILNKAFWTRPQKIKNIDFNLQDLWEKSSSMRKSISVSSCSITNLSGALTQAKTFQVQLEQTGNRLLSILQTIYDLFSNIFPFSLFKGRRIIGKKISYYGLIDGSFSFVAGTAVKKGDGEISIQNTEYISKQIGFIIRQLKQNFHKEKIKFLLYTLLLSVLFMYFSRWALQKYRKRKIKNLQLSEEEEQNIPAGHQCIICFSRSRQIIFKPCKHYGLCYSCYLRLNKPVCPVCKQEIEGIIRIIVKNQ